MLSASKTLPPAPVSAEAGAGSFAGTWAVRAEVPLVWSNIAVTPPVNGPLRFSGRIVRDAIGEGRYRDVLSLCSLELPSWRHALHGATTPPHRLIVPDAVFDEGFFPPSQSYEVHETRADGEASTLRSQSMALVAGIRLADPLSAPWPFSDDEVAAVESLDDDLDGNPGISLLLDMREGHAPVSGNIFGSAKVAKIYSAIRLRFAFSVRAENADRLEGSIRPILEIRRVHGKNPRATWPDGLALGAEVRDAKSDKVIPTTRSHLNLLSRMFSPRPDVSRPASISMQRVSSSITNKQIRAGAF